MYKNIIPKRDRDAMRALLQESDRIMSAQMRRHHTQHSLEQVQRFARLFREEGTEAHWRRVAQMPMNFGRAQELLGSIGGVDLWWTPFSTYWEAKDWAALELMAAEYLEQLGLANPAP